MFIVTNKASSVFAAIEKIAATPSKLEKEALIKTAGTSSPMFMKVVKAAYDPFITYGMRKVPARDTSMAPGTNTLDEPAWWEMLTDLSTRKLSGTAAWDAVQRAVNFLDEASGELLVRIIRKDLRAGFTDGTINRVFKGTIAEFPYMRCTLPEKSNMAKWDWSVGIISQEKADGMFTNVNKDEQGNVWLTTRQGSPVPLENLGLLGLAIEAIVKPGTQSHGEITIYKDGLVLPREVGNGMLNSVLQGGSLEDGCYARLDLWDQIPLSAVKPKGSCPTPYKERLRGLIEQCANSAISPEVRKHIGIVPTRIVKSKAEAYAHYRDLLKKGKEGTVVKHPQMEWKDSNGNKDQVKLKLEADMELRIVQVLPGTVGTKNEGRAGSVECQSECGTLRVNVAIKNEKMRDDVDKDWEAWTDRIMTVRANSIMAPSESSDFYSLFLPRFVEDVARFDKDVADDLEQIKGIFQAAVEVA